MADDYSELIIRIKCAPNHGHESARISARGSRTSRRKAACRSSRLDDVIWHSKTGMSEHRVSIFDRTGSENDIRAQVTRRKVSGGTRNDLGGTAAMLFWLSYGSGITSARGWMDIPNQPEILSLLKIP
jgi:hypothetical protein